MASMPEKKPGRRHKLDVAAAEGSRHDQRQHQHGNRHNQRADQTIPDSVLRNQKDLRRRQDGYELCEIDYR